MLRKVLVIEDEDEIAQLVESQLSSLSCAVRRAGDGRTGLAEATAGSYDLIILDVTLPGIDGFEICRRIRTSEHYMPILMLSSGSTELDRVLGLELGADHCVPKPFSALELLARIKAIFRLVDKLRGACTSDAPTVRCRDLRIDTERHEVTIGSRRIDLTAREFQLLLHLARNPGRVYSRSQLLDQVWGYHHSGYEHTVNTHINRLRAKIEENPNEPDFIQTVWGVGYRFRTQTADAGVQYRVAA